MRAMIAVAAMFAISLVAEACPPPPGPPQPDASDAGPGPPTPTPDAAPSPPAADASPPAPTDGGATAYARACANLAAVQCSEGTKPNCAAVLEHAQGTLTTFDVPCLTGAKTKAEVRACKPHNVACP